MKRKCQKMTYRMTNLLRKHRGQSLCVHGSCTERRHVGGHLGRKASSPRRMPRDAFWMNEGRRFYTVCESRKELGISSLLSHPWVYTGKTLQRLQKILRSLQLNFACAYMWYMMWECLCVPREANSELWVPSSAALHLRFLLFETGSLTGFDAVQSGLPVSSGESIRLHPRPVDIRRLLPCPAYMWVLGIQTQLLIPV